MLLVIDNSVKFQMSVQKKKKKQIRENAYLKRQAKLWRHLKMMNCMFGSLKLSVTVVILGSTFTF